MNMRSRWVPVKPGDVLLAEGHMNKLGRKAFGPTIGTATLLEKQCVVEITGLDVSAESTGAYSYLTDTDDSGLYLAKARHFDATTDLITLGDWDSDSWVTNTDDGADYILDGRPAGLACYVGQVGIAQWNHQAHLFLPINFPTVVWGVLQSNLDYNDTTGVGVTVWDRDLSTTTGNTINNVLPPWTMISGTLSSLSRVKVECIKGKWYVTMAVC